MWFNQWGRVWLGAPRTRHVSRRQRPRCACVRLRLEQLEDRTLPSNFTAASVSDLIADITAANAAGGTNTITLSAPTSNRYVLTAVDNTTDGPTGLPVVAKDNLTIIGSGDTIERSTASGTPDFRLFDVASHASLTLETLTLQNGLEDGSGSSAQGGAIYNQGTLVLSAVSVQGNSAQGSDATKKGNPGSDAEGGGIWSNGTVTLENSTVVEDNLAVGGMGGVARQQFGTPGNGGNGYGGGLYVAGGTVSIASSTISNNKAQGGTGAAALTLSTGGTGGTGSGGGVYVDAGTATLTGDTLDSNTAQGGEGGLGNSLADAGNGGNSFGGSLDAVGGTVTLCGDTLEGNAAVGGSACNGGCGLNGGNAYGGGVYAAGASVTLSNDTVEFNAARGDGANLGQGFGGGIYIVSRATVYIDSFTVAHTINNTDSSGLNGPTANINGTYILQNC